MVTEIITEFGVGFAGLKEKPIRCTYAYFSHAIVAIFRASLVKVRALSLMVCSIVSAEKPWLISTSSVLANVTFFS